MSAKRVARASKKDLYFDASWRFAIGGILIAGGMALRHHMHMGEKMDMDGTIPSWVPYFFVRGRRRVIVPTDFDEERIAKEVCETSPDMYCNTNSIYGTDGYLYRMLHFTFDTEKMTYPFQSLIRCKNDIDDTEDGAYMYLKCEPDYTHIMPLYQRLFCMPLAIGESCIGLFKPEDKPRALVIGLGGGGWTGFLQTLYPHMEIDCVEIEPEVVRQAKQWFSFEEGANTHVTVQDGEVFLAEHVKKIAAGKACKYDVAFVDIASSGEAPECMSRVSFYENLNDVMADKSTLGIHINTRNDENYPVWQAAAIEHGQQSITLRYNSAHELGSSVLFASKGWQLKDALNLNRATLLITLRKWSFAHKLPFDAGKKIQRAATPSFPGLKHRYFPTREGMQREQDRKAEIQKQLQRESVSSSAADAKNA